MEKEKDYIFHVIYREWIRVRKGGFKYGGSTQYSELGIMPKPMDKPSIVSHEMETI